MADPEFLHTEPTGGDRDTLLRDARHRLAVLEIETHKLRAELARMEAAGEEEAAARLSARLHEQETQLAASPYFESPGDASPETLPPYEPQRRQPLLPGDSPHGPRRPSRSKTRRSKTRRDIPRSQHTPRPQQAHPTPAVESVKLSMDADRKQQASEKGNRRATPAWLVSLGMHALVLLALALGTYAVQQQTPDLLLANAPVGEDDFDDFAEVSLEAVEAEDLDVEEITDVLDPSELAETLSHEIQTPVESVALGAESALPGMLSALPSDMAGLMAGESGGSPNGGAGAGKEPGSGKPTGAQFFGSRSRGNRFVFVVDNSGSMQNGRMETTLLELLNSIGSMDAKQEFHVLFFSDQTYPMFFPAKVDKLLPATRENRERLRQWLPTVEMCKGGKLKAAMDYAASLEPQVVYLLSDGDYLFRTEQGQRVKSATLRYLTEETDEWPFVVHTLGMTVRNRDDAEALALIAQSHQGVFKHAAVSPTAKRMSQQRRIPYHNKGPGDVWGSKVR